MARETISISIVMAVMALVWSCGVPHRGVAMAAPTSAKPTAPPASPPTTKVAAAAAPKLPPGCKTVPKSLVVKTNSLMDAPCIYIPDGTIVDIDASATLLIVATDKLFWGRDVTINRRGLPNTSPGADGQDYTWPSSGNGCGDQHGKWDSAVSDCRDHGVNCHEAINYGKRGNKGYQAAGLNLAVANVVFTTPVAGVIDIRGGSGSSGGKSKGKGYQCQCHGSHYWQSQKPPDGDNGDIGDDAPTKIVTHGPAADPSRNTLLGLVKATVPSSVLGRVAPSMQDFIDNEVKPLRKQASDGNYQAVPLK